LAGQTQGQIAGLDTQLNQESNSGTSLAGVTGSSLGTTPAPFTDTQLNAYNQWLADGHTPDDAGTLSDTSLFSGFDNLPTSSTLTFNGDGQSVMDPNATDPAASPPVTLSAITAAPDPILQHMLQGQGGLVGNGYGGSLADQNSASVGSGIDGPSMAAVGALGWTNANITGGDKDWSIGAVKSAANFLPNLANGAVDLVKNLAVWELHHDKVIQSLMPEAANNAADALSQTQSLKIPTLSYSNGVQGIAGALTTTGLAAGTIVAPGIGEEEIAIGGFARLSGRAVDGVSNSADGLLANPQNIANAPRLSQQLTLQSAESSFNADGTLTQDAIDNSSLIMSPNNLSNPAIPSGYGKYSTQTFQSPYGNFQTHFYMNADTGDVYYGLDYKSVFNSMSGVSRR
jgi:hypothetical protein